MKNYQLEFDGKLLERGFWVYVWEIYTPRNEKLFYVGRTGDSSSPNAASPFSRMSAHFSKNPKGNALLRNLRDKKIDPEKCKFKLHAYGPIFTEQKAFDKHKPFRDKAASIEVFVAKKLKERGYEVIGNHPKNTKVNEVESEADEIIENLKEKFE